MAQQEKEFPSGLFVSPPRPTAPDFVKARISLKVSDVLAWLQGKSGQDWVRLDVKQSKRVADDGSEVWYAEVDTWEKPGAKASSGGSDGLPF
jgi:hypothetical protein